MSEYRNKLLKGYDALTRHGMDPINGKSFNSRSISHQMFIVWFLITLVEFGTLWLMLNSSNLILNISALTLLILAMFLINPAITYTWVRSFHHHLISKRKGE
jgi:hypothetical protein